MTFDGEDVFVFLAQLAQGIGQAEQVVAVWAARPARRGNVAGDLLFRCGAKEGGVVARGDVDQSDIAAAVIEMDVDGQAQVAVLFTLVEMGKNVGLDQVGHAGALGVRIFDQGHHAPRCRRRAAMVVRALPEPARPAVDSGRAPFDEREVRLEDQRAIAEQPYLMMAVETVHLLVDGGGVVRHGP
jgi:hypothetical protein